MDGCTITIGPYLNILNSICCQLFSRPKMARSSTHPTVSKHPQNLNLFLPLPPQVQFHHHNL
ncbi:hypothetical protein Hanom_Chr05g00428061 [Helianthus anomalus]